MFKEKVWKLLSKQEQQQLLLRPICSINQNVKEHVQAIIKNVRDLGDQACIDLTYQFDGIKLDCLTVSQKEYEEAHCKVSSETQNALKRVIKQLYAFHLPQKLNAYQAETSPGILCENLPRPLSRVGLYVPGGSAPLVSTVLMMGVPSQIAGCPLRVLCTPPNKEGEINPNILIAAELCGITKIYKLGGAQAIAAMAFGTETIPKVDKLFGPGNAFVTEAKIQVSLDTAGAQYDSPAGPSEVMIIADEHANPEFIAADLLSQAEHGNDSQVILLCTDFAISNKVKIAIQEQLLSLSRYQTIQQALCHSRLIMVDSVDKAIEIANEYAPEHLILQIKQARNYVEKISCAGSVFLGPWSPEAAGDYASGTNHVLPTYGYAKCFSGLSVKDFMKTISIQECSKKGLADIAESIRILADIEGLDAHKNAVDIRLRGA